MTNSAYPKTLERFERIVRGRDKGRTMPVLIVDSPWLPGYAGIDTLDFYFDPAAWLHAYCRVHRDLPGAALLPGAWVEFGMAAEPSGWGAGIRWSRQAPPDVRRVSGGLTALLEAEPPDPARDGLMPVVLRQYERARPELEAKGIAPRMAAARGPLAVASHLLGVTELLTATQLEPDRCLALLERTTELCIRWLQCQLERMPSPLGILVLDDVVGLMGPDDAGRFALPYLRRIFESFPDLIRVFHNDTPNADVFDGLAAVGIDVFNFSHDIDPAEARRRLGPDIVLMGNVPPVDVLVRGTPGQVREATEAVVRQAAEFGPMLISAGGGVSPGTPIENLQAMVDVVQNA